MYVENLNGAKNQFIIYTKKAVIFQSYETPIAVYVRASRDIFVQEEKYSRTTTKYTNKFINEIEDRDEVIYVNAEAFDMIMEEL